MGSIEMVGKYYWGNDFNEGSEIVNEHLRSGIISVEGLEKDSESVIFNCRDGYDIEIYHEQDCCEHVCLESSDSIDNKDDIYTNCEWCELEIVNGETERYFMKEFIMDEIDNSIINVESMSYDIDESKWYVTYSKEVK